MKDEPKGEPIPFHRAAIYPKHLAAVQRVLESGWLTTGKACREFEEAFAKYVHGKHAVAVNSCTAALHLALMGLGVSAGDEVITSPITFVSAVNVIDHLGAVPVFCDVRREDLTLDPARLPALITRRTKAIVATHMAGFPCQMDRIQAIAKERRIPVVTDAAHAIEAGFHDKRSGQLGIAACYSFYVTKNMTTGEGGMLVTSDAELAAFARKMSLHGMDKDAWKRYVPGAYRHWDVDAPGWKYNMTDVAAALGSAQLPELDNWLGTRRMIWQYYESEFERDRRITLLRPADPDVYPALHLFILRVKQRDRVMALIQERGVGVGVHFRGVHRLRYWSKTKAARSAKLPVADQATDEVLSIPLYPSLSIQDAGRVVRCVKQVLDEIGA